MGIIEINICWNTRIKNNSYQLWFVLGTLWANFPQNLQKILKILSSFNWEYHIFLKLAMGE